MKTKMLLFLVLALITALGSCVAMFGGFDHDPLEAYSDADWHVVSLSIYSLPYRTEYEVGEDPDWTGLEVMEHYADGSDARFDIHFPNRYEISGFDSSSPGAQIITVSKKGKSATFIVTVM